MQFTPESKLHLPRIKAFIATLAIPGWQEPRDESMLLTAFIHKSYACDYVGAYAHNERLEFLGDGILGAIINKYLFCAFVDQPESQLTLYKIRLVREETLALVAKEIGLDAVVLLSNGEERQAGRQKASVLSDTLEAFIGYMYLDQPLAVLEYFIHTFVYSKLDAVKHENQKSAKSCFQEYVQKTQKELPVYTVVPFEIDPKGNVLVYEASVLVQGEKKGSGLGKNKKIAEEEAARMAREQTGNEK